MNVMKISQSNLVIDECNEVASDLSKEDRA